MKKRLVLILFFVFTIHLFAENGTKKALSPVGEFVDSVYQNVQQDLKSKENAAALYQKAFNSVTDQIYSVFVDLWTEEEDEEKKASLEEISKRLNEFEKFISKLQSALAQDPIVKNIFLKNILKKLNCIILGIYPKSKSYGSASTDFFKCYFLSRS